MAEPPTSTSPPSVLGVVTTHLTSPDGSTVTLTTTAASSPAPQLSVRSEDDLMEFDSESTNQPTEEVPEEEVHDLLYPPEDSDPLDLQEEKSVDNVAVAEASKKLETEASPEVEVVSTSQTPQCKDMRFTNCSHHLHFTSEGSELRLQRRVAVIPRSTWIAFWEVDGTLYWHNNLTEVTQYARPAEIKLSDQDLMILSLSSAFPPKKPDNDNSQAGKFGSGMMEIYQLINRPIKTEPMDYDEKVTNNDSISDPPVTQSPIDFPKFKRADLLKASREGRNLFAEYAANMSKSDSSTVTASLTTTTATTSTSQGPKTTSKTADTGPSVRPKTTSKTASRSRSSSKDSKSKTKTPKFVIPKVPKPKETNKTTDQKPAYNEMLVHIPSASVVKSEAEKSLSLVQNTMRDYRSACDAHMKQMAKMEATLKSVMDRYSDAETDTMSVSSKTSNTGKRRRQRSKSTNLPPPPTPSRSQSSSSTRSGNRERRSRKKSTLLPPPPPPEHQVLSDKAPPRKLPRRDRLPTKFIAELDDESVEDEPKLPPGTCKRCGGNHHHKKCTLKITEENRCTYKWCRNRLAHILGVCPTVRYRCQHCHYRGHQDPTAKICRTDLRELLLTFENVADKVMGVDRRNDILAWGFFNIHSYRMMAIMEENHVSYHSLTNIHPKDAMAYIKEVKALINPPRTDAKKSKK